jgi:replicative DNA helicase
MASFTKLIRTTDVQEFRDGVSTGFQDLDAATGGFLPGALWLLPPCQPRLTRPS